MHFALTLNSDAYTLTHNPAQCRRAIFRKEDGMRAQARGVIGTAAVAAGSGRRRERRSGRRGTAVVALLAALTSAAALAATPAQAQGQPPCAEREALLRGFAERYGEVPHSIAMTDRGTLLEVLVSPAGTWTMLVTQPAGPTCIVASGREWQTVAAAEPGA
jgi:hypothetical protein